MGTATLPEIITEKIKLVSKKEDCFLSLHEPRFEGNEWKYIKECLDTGWVSSVGKYVDLFEQKLAEWTGSPYAVAVVNGTAALHISLLLAGVKQNDEVIIPSLTFIATANAVSYCGAIPHFVDVSEETLGIDPGLLRTYLKSECVIRSDGFLYNRRTNRKISAIVPMHTFGHPVDMDPLLELCAEMNLIVVEDAAESLGSYYKGQHTGTLGRVAAISFNGNKIITTGGGGAVLTSDEKLAKAAKHLTTTAKQPHRWIITHDEIGYNYRMPNLNAALGCAQLEQLPKLLHHKRALAEAYRLVFENTEGISFYQERPFAKSNYWLNTIVLNKPNRLLIDQILMHTNDSSVMTRPIWTPMHKQPMFRNCPSMELTVTERLEQTIVNIPSSAFLGVAN